jgi:uncharacterized membrane protein YkvA (DUF1232 family)
MEQVNQKSSGPAIDLQETSASDFEHSINEAAEMAGPVSKARADRFYDRVRGSIASYLERKGEAAGHVAEFLLLAPDFFMLLWRLTSDGRVSSKNKVLLGTGVAYFILPFDIIPEAIVGPIGYLDDLVVSVYILNKVLRDTDLAVLREHWSGGQDILESIQNVLRAADGLVGSGFVRKIKNLMK